ncbi:MAG: Rieske 2Fe-2S domain-containing protein [Caldilineaceae bacterium]|nr:Rieske 2Fe-2S domain-containing protein [Caldilineaceae bacterium]MCB0124929.1 Rieske 2Fe-2S domain-containing protein [Caldilineaceae bacterium]
MKVELCKLDEIPANGSKVVPFFGRELHVYWQNGKPRAVANVCMHFGGPLECQEDKFVCLWHNAAFAMDDGRRLSGPAPANSRLMFLSTVVEDGALHYVWGEA